MAEVNVTKDLENKTLKVEFVANGPKDKVWQAYTNKEQFEKWWGPEGWDTTAKKFDFTPGGRVHYGMKCVDENQGEWFGQTSWGLMEIQSMDEGNSFTYKDYFSDESGTPNQEMPKMTVTNTFTEEDGKTRVVSLCVAASAEQIEKQIEMGMVEGYSSQLNKLEQLLAQ